MRRPRHRFAPLLALLAALADGCQRAPELEPVALPPDLTAMDDLVQRQFRDAWEGLEALRRDPQAPHAALADAHGRLAMLFHAYRRPAEAGAAYRNATRLAPGEFRWFYLLALADRLAGDNAAAEAAVRRALALRPHDVPARLLAAELLADRGDLGAAEAAYAELLAGDPTLVPALVGRAKIALARGAPAEALEALRAALVRQPDASLVHYLLGQAHAALGDPERAARHLAAVPATNLLREPVGVDDPLRRELASLVIGSLLHTRGGARAAARSNYELALIEFEQALAAEPGLVNARFGKAFALAQLGEVERAAAELAAVLAVEPERVEALELLGELQLRAGDRATAEATLRRALAVDPLAERSHLALGDLLRGSGRIAEALGHYDEAVALDPRLGEAHLGRIVALRALGRGDEAAAALERARRALPDSRPLALLAARDLATAPDPARRDASQALAAAQRLFAEEPDLAAAETVAMALAAQGDQPGARRWQEAAAAAIGDEREAGWVAERLGLYRAGRLPREAWRLDERLLARAVTAPPAI